MGGPGLNFSTKNNRLTGDRTGNDLSGPDCRLRCRGIRKKARGA